MRQRATQKVMEFLRDRSRIIRPNNLKIHEWVDSYIDSCLLKGEPVTILTQLCISKDLEVRYALDGNNFFPTKKERRLFETDLPAIAQVFKDQGLRLDWWITFNRSYLTSGQISSELESKFKVMIQELAEPFTKAGWLIVADWENEILCAKPTANLEVFANVPDFVPTSALRIEIERHSDWARGEAGLSQTDEELKHDVYYQISCEAEEGRLLQSTASPLGEFILIPLESPERYDFFELLAPNFKKRIVAALPPYPWRIKD